MSDERPDPDVLLASINKESGIAQRGKLKIFLGMCPGVGKTYAMLQAARQRQTEGVEVVIGIVETHQRKETEALIEGLPVVPRARIEYRGTILEEMDIDAILLWHPGVAVVDELAHTNTPGSRHTKRYQDVLELLDAGIDVLTTVNVQHIESRADAVRQITGASVYETVPDSVLDIADEIILIDLTPERLRARLADGKVYLGDRAAAAADSFFREGNLTALREMSLRLVAEHVDRDLRELMQAKRIAGPWKTGDRLLVGVSASPFSEKLIRYTRRLATTMEASWIAVNIESSQVLGEFDQARLNRHLALARRLGAEVVSTAGVHVGETLLRVARQHNVTQIVIGKPSGNLWQSFWRRSPVDWLIRYSGDIDLHMVRSEAAQVLAGGNKTGKGPVPEWNQYGASLGIAVGVTLAGLLVHDFTGYWAVALFYLLAVVLAATRLQRWPTMLLATLSALLWNYLFIPPRFTFHIELFQDFVMFGMFFVIALVMGHFTSRLSEREQVERRGEERATILYRLTRALATSSSLAAALEVVMQEMRGLFSATATVLLRDGNGLTPQPGGNLEITAKEDGVASWAFQKKQTAGRGTDTLPDAAALHIPLLAGERAVGVLAVASSSVLSDEQRQLLETIAAQLAVFVEKERALQRSRASEVAAQSERLQKALFDCVSHELKTPIAALVAGLEHPQPDKVELQQAVRRLKRTVNHLLDATRLESGQLQLGKEWCDPAELAREAVILADLDERQFVLNVTPGLSPVLVDGGLIAQALSFLLTNAAAYSNPGQNVELIGQDVDGSLVYRVLDHGSGLAPGEEVKVFEKFYRGPGKAPGGLGLGLSIARQLVEAHGGTITAENRREGGACFTIRLPRTEAMKMPKALVDDERT